MDHIFDENQPIYLQIKQRICAAILRGDYRPGDKLPGIVEMAMEFKVNHNTIQRVYMELIRDGIAISRRGEGTFVTQDSATLQKLENELEGYLLENFVREMQRLGHQEDELADILVQYIQSKRHNQ
ncbi:GntR family transcriptional regulator [Pelolinea submarina]|uniref:GntR family transcriptional regulator n=1 Tax=Pelolinea submarina TaxID=913107 RepID=A0A347ZWC5_9CHLR|nr:GntR family transcriptional regulator [Pelolinea submarina]REG05348.1 GntR family transcriptional regulator [Pelolinea submarina]BBB49606.1 GntR family transcriptional regulator [Pelolinea submarina]